MVLISKEMFEATLKNFSSDSELVNLFKIAPLLRKLIFDQNSYLNSTGFWKSYILRKPLSKDNEPIPWMNYTVIEFLKQRLNTNMVLFEYGSGYSTLFFSKLVKKVISVEYNQDWYERISKEELKENVILHYQKFEQDGEYCRKINETDDKYEVVIIDGRDRVRCAINAVKNLSEDGVIIFDDTNRTRYIEGYSYLFKIGFKKLDFEGLKPTDFRLNKTSIFYREGNCFGI